MIFVSYWFIAFALAFFPLYCLVRDWRLRLGVLAVGSVLFHGHFAGAAGVAPIIVLALATYLAGLSRRRWLCISAMLLSVAALILYKYTKFLSQSIGSLAPAAGEAITTYVQPL